MDPSVAARRFHLFGEIQRNPFSLLLIRRRTSHERRVRAISRKNMALARATLFLAERSLSIKIGVTYFGTSTQRLKTSRLKTDANGRKMPVDSVTFKRLAAYLSAARFRVAVNAREDALSIPGYFRPHHADRSYRYDLHLTRTWKIRCLSPDRPRVS